MAISIHQLIAAISPDTYCEAAKRREVKQLVREGQKQGSPLTFQRAAAVAKPLPFNEELMDEMEIINAFALLGLKHPLEHHTLAYDSMDDSLEALYFWLLDWLTQERGCEVTKLTDNSAVSPGSSPFQDWSNRLMKMQKEGVEMLTSAQKLIRAILDDVDKLRALEHLVRLVEAAKTVDGDHRNMAVEALRLIRTEERKIQKMFRDLYDTYLDDVKNGKANSKLHEVFLKSMRPDYKQKTNAARIVVDFIAGMTDSFFNNQHRELFTPKP